MILGVKLDAELPLPACHGGDRSDDDLDDDDKKTTQELRAAAYAGAVRRLSASAPSHHQR